MGVGPGLVLTHLSDVLVSVKKNCDLWLKHSLIEFLEDALLVVIALRKSVVKSTQSHT